MSKRILGLSGREWAWSLYDVANSAFYTTVVAGFFPIFFKEYWSVADVRDSTAALAYSSSVAALVVAFLAPWVGALMDRKAATQRGLGFFSAVGALSCFVLAFIPQGEGAVALAVFALSNVAAATALSLYDSLLLAVTSQQRYHRVSLVGYALGYLGGGVLLAAHILLIIDPARWGLSDKATAVQVAFFSVGMWWMFFALPLLLYPLMQEKRGSSAAVGWASLLRTAKGIVRQRPLAFFLLAYWLYIDGVATLMRMAVDFGVSLGFPTQDLMISLLLVQLVGFPASLGFIAIARYFGVKKGIYLALILYISVTVGAYFMSTVEHFYALALGIALAQGGLQALSRSYYGLWVPPGQAAEYFGFYNTFGKFAAVLGPVLFGVVVQLSDHRSALLSLLLLFVGGAWLMRWVPAASKVGELRDAGGRRT